MASLFPAGNASAQGESLQWAITPYVWLPTTRLDITLDETSIGGQVGFKDVIDSIDAAFMGSVEAGKGQWSAFLDITHIDASDVTERPLLTIDAKNQVQFIDAAVSWWPGGIDAPLAVFGGVRYTGFDDRFVITGNVGGNELVNTRSTSDYYDALLGIRYRIDLAERWSILTRGDASFGDSEGTWIIRASLAYAVGQQRQNQVLLGYQFKQAEFDDGDVQTEFQFDGLTAGFSFRF